MPSDRLRVSISTSRSAAATAFILSRTSLAARAADPPPTIVLRPE